MNENNDKQMKALLLFLSKFLKGKQINELGDYWEPVIGTCPENVIKGLVDEGFLVQADLETEVDIKYRASDLKTLLKERELPSTGNKKDLIRRIIAVDSEGIRKSLVGQRVFCCSVKGKKLAEGYLANEKAKKDAVDQKVITYLQDRKFREASLEIAAYEALQVFSRGLGIDWSHHSPDNDIAILTYIFNSKPKNFSHLNDTELQFLKIAAGMMHLWGTNNCNKWLPKDFMQNSNLNNKAAARTFKVAFNVAARMLEFRQIHRTTIERYKKQGLKKVEILGAPDSCDACKHLAEKSYSIDEVPELPYENCCHEKGCRCCYLPVVDPIIE